MISLNDYFTRLAELGPRVQALMDEAAAKKFLDKYRARAYAEKEIDSHVDALERGLELIEAELTRTEALASAV